MSDGFDIVVAGAGHNSLVAAAYLSKAGYRCLLLEGRDVLGGNCCTEELTLPGFRHDSCGTAHVLLQDSPMLRNDELGLADHGLEYIHPEIVCHAPFPDGSYLTQYHDIDRTCAEFAKFSKKDADAYRRMLAEYDAVKTEFDAASYTPVGFGPAVNDRLAKHPDGKKWLRRQAMSAWEIIRDNFEDEHTRSFMLWMAMQTVVPPEWPMTGRLAYSLVWGRQRWSWCVPKGGSGAFTDVLVRLIEAHGGAALTGKRVARLIVEGGRCTGVECEDGSQFRAGKAVLSTIHVKHLRRHGAARPVGRRLRRGRRDLPVRADAVRDALRHDRADALCGRRRHDRADRGRDAVDPDARAAARLRFRLRRRPTPRSLSCCRCVPPSPIPSQAPDGKHILKVLGMQPYDLKEGPAHWDAIKDEVAEANLNWLRRFSPNLTDDKILARVVESPLDLERRNPHNWRGSCHGGAQNAAQAGPLRPAAGWAQHRMPIPGLYQTGATTHPGGSISGGPGRNAATVMLKDFGTTLDEVVRQDATRRKPVSTAAK